MKPKQWIKYVKKLEKNGFAICDGISEPAMSYWEIFFPFFIVGVITFIVWKFEWIWSKIRGK